MKPANSISLLTATCIVVANMIGTGIFTSLGFQVGGLPSGFAIVTLWFVGGVCALCGALSYAELGAALPRSGGEYNFLSRIYHPAVGFLAGWISTTVGFAAPVAIAAMPFGTYLASIFPNTNPMLLSFGVVWVATLLLLFNLQLGTAFQVSSTILKVALVLVIIVAGFSVKATQPISFLPKQGDSSLLLSGPFAVSLYWVMYAYSGWNASTYIAGEIRDPTRNILRSVGLGTLFVVTLYLLINCVFLRSTPIAEMTGKQQVALLAGNHLFGASGGKVMALLICLGLVSTVSAMMWIGPRVTVAMGEDLRAFAWFAVKTSRGIPLRATLLQFAIVNLLLLTATFETVVNYVQFSLALCSTLAVIGLFVLRWRQPNLPRPYRVWGYPFTPLIFLAISFWMLWNLLASPVTRKPSLLGLTTAMLGLVIYFLSPKRKAAQ